MNYDSKSRKSRMRDINPSKVQKIGAMAKALIKKGNFSTEDDARKVAR